MNELDHLREKINVLRLRTINLIEAAKKHYLVANSVGFKFDEKQGKLLFMVSKYELNEDEYKEVLARISQAKKSAIMLNDAIGEYYQKVESLDPVNKQQYTALMFNDCLFALKKMKESVRTAIYQKHNILLPVNYSLDMLDDNIISKKTALRLLTEIKNYAFNKYEEMDIETL